MVPDQIKTAILNLVPEAGTVPKYEVVAAAAAARISRDDVRNYIKILLPENRLFECKIREGKSRSEVHLSRQEKAGPQETNHHEETARLRSWREKLAGGKLPRQQVALLSQREDVGGYIRSIPTDIFFLLGHRSELLLRQLLPLSAGCPSLRVWLVA